MLFTKYKDNGEHIEYLLHICRFIFWEMQETNLCKFITTVVKSTACDLLLYVLYNSCDIYAQLHVMCPYAYMLQLIANI